jgi:hypothetical protein
VDNRVLEGINSEHRERKRARWLGIRDRMLQDFGIDTPEVREKLARDEEEARKE